MKQDQVKKIFVCRWNLYFLFYFHFCGNIPKEFQFHLTVKCYFTLNWTMCSVMAKYSVYVKRLENYSELQFSVCQLNPNRHWPISGTNFSASVWYLTQTPQNHSPPLFDENATFLFSFVSMIFKFNPVLISRILCSLVILLFISS